MAAVFPVVGSGAFDTNPSYSGSFIPQLWSNKLNAKFYAHTMLAEIANTDWEGEIKNKGDTIRIRTAPSITINDYAGAGTTLTAQVPVPIFQDMQINKGKYFSVQINDVLAHQADMDLMNMFTEDAAKQMKIQIENDTFFQYFVTEGATALNKGATAGALSGAYNLGTDTAPIDQATPANVLNAILQMSSTLDEQNVPEDGRWLVMSPRDRQLLMQTDIAQAYFTGDQSSTIRTGKIGMLDRFTVYVSNLLPKGNAAKATVAGLTDPTTGATLTSAKKRRMMVAGTKHACAFASSISKTEPLRNQTDFGDIVRGLNVFGHKVLKPEALVTAIVGSAS
jgi:hypothetical protein|tara:strand:- start:513 stop:1523 length:1011 start_codon:yes stop_codon:yes gene_type:complete